MAGQRQVNCWEINQSIASDFFEKKKKLVKKGVKQKSEHQLQAIFIFGTNFSKKGYFQPKPEKLISPLNCLYSNYS